MSAETTQSSLLNRLHDPADNDSWAEFYQLYHPLLLRYVRSQGVSREDAEDLCQNIFLDKLRPAMTHFQLDRGKGRFRTWLFEVTLNAIRDFVRRKNLPNIGTIVAGPLAPSVTEELSREWNDLHHQQIMQHAMGKCREFFEPKTWACFELRTLRQKAGPEVAAELGLTTSAVYTNAHRVLEKIRAVCTEYDEELNPT